MRIITRGTWGFTSWRSEPYRLNPARVEYMTWHYQGANPCLRETGNGVPQAIHRYHRDGQKWAGIGYNFVIDSAGNVFEGRGLRYQGAHKPSGPGRNPEGIGVQLHLGGSEQPTPAMLAAAAELKAWCEGQLGKQLEDTWHGAGFGTACPGPAVIEWVRRGGPDTVTAGPSKASAVTVTTGTPALLVVDGKAGEWTYRALQWMLGRPQTGRWDRMDSRALQQWAGRARTGVLSRDDVRAIQTAAGVPRTGVWAFNPRTVDATTTGIQKLLNQRIVDATAGYDHDELVEAMGNPTSTNQLWTRVNTALNLGQPNRTPYPNRQTARALQALAGFPQSGVWRDGSGKDGATALGVWLESRRGSQAPKAVGALAETPPQYRPLVDAAAARHDIPAALIAAVIKQESRWDRYAVSKSGARGLAQFKEAAARDMGVVDPFDPAQAVDGCAKYLAWLRGYLATDRVDLILSGYNAGPGATKDAGGVHPRPETQQYVRIIMADPGVSALNGKA